MHELSIAHALVRTVGESLPDASTRVAEVRLRIGVLSGVAPSALDFAYDVATQGTPLAGSALLIDTAPLVVQCPTCGPQPLADIRDFTCPVCGVPCGEVVGGQELEVVGVTLASSAAGAGPEADLAELHAGLLAKNDLLAAGLRGWFASAGVRVSNWISGPGSGKTALLEAVLRAAQARGLRTAALVGDCATDNDARRLARSGALVRQIVTDGTCHLEAEMVSSHLDGWDLAAVDLLAIENVGNLVCPAGFDLGEDTRLTLMSVTEGEDKPEKYPKAFHDADVVVITKVDLAEPCDWDRAVALASIARVAPGVAVVETSARTGVGVERVLDALVGERPSTEPAAPSTEPAAPSTAGEGHAAHHGTSGGAS